MYDIIVESISLFFTFDKTTPHSTVIKIDQIQLNPKRENYIFWSKGCDSGRGTELACLCGMFLFGQECWFTGTAEVLSFFLTL